MLGNEANLHSVLMWGLFWIVLSRPATRAGAVLLGVVGLLTALSEVQVFFLLPLMAIAAWLQRRARWRRSFLVLGGPLLGAAAQLVATLEAPRRAGASIPLSALDVAAGFVINAVMPDVAAIDEVGPLLAAGGLVLGIAVLAIVVALAVGSLRHATALQRTALVGAAVLAPLVFSVSTLMDPGTYYEYATLTAAQATDVWLSRYGVVPGMLVLGRVIVAAAVRGGSGTGSRLREDLTAIAVVGVAALLVVGYVPSSTRRDAGPTWSTQIAAATRECAENPSLTQVELDETLGWKVPVQCDRLIPDRGDAAAR